jgi:hypothetical protein
VIGIDIDKNSFHVVGHGNYAAAEVVTRAGANTARQAAAITTPFQAPDGRTCLMCPLDGGTLEPIFEF